MQRTATDLRAHLYELLDHVAKTGRPIEVMRNGVQLAIVRTEPRAKTKAPRTLSNLIVGDPDDLVHVKWPWKAGKDL